MGKPIGASVTPKGDWRNKALCRNLTPQESDAIFFPKPGGKSKRADEFCKTCPVRKECLENALRMGPSAVGFWAGTTEPERRRMAGFLKMLPSELDIPEPTRKDRQLRRIPVTANLLDDPLYGVEGPSLEDERKMYGF